MRFDILRGEGGHYLAVFVGEMLVVDFDISQGIRSFGII